MGHVRSGDAASGGQEIFGVQRNQRTEGDVESRIGIAGLLFGVGLVNIHAEVDGADGVGLTASVFEILVGNDIFAGDAPGFANADHGGKFHQVYVSEQIADQGKEAHGVFDLPESFLGRAGEFIAVAAAFPPDMGPLDQSLAVAGEFDQGGVGERDIANELLAVFHAVFEEGVPVQRAVSGVFGADAADAEHHGHRLKDAVAGTADFKRLPVSGAVDDDPGQNQLPSGFVLDKDSADIPSLHPRFARGRIEQHVDSELHGIAVHQQSHLGRIEGDVPQSAPRLPFHEFFTELGVEAFLLLIVEERRKKPERPHSAEFTSVFDQRHLCPFAGRRDRRAHSRRTGPHYENIAFIADRDIQNFSDHLLHLELLLF